MTGFDVAAGVILLVSGLVGFVRGATREVTTAVAFIAGAAAAIFALHFSGPVARHFIHAAWLANVTAVLVVFLIVYIAVRLAGGHLTRGVRQTGLSSIDRVLGLVIGLARGLVAVGVIVLLVRAATPPERMPQWLTRARVYPVADAAGAALRALAPKGLQMAKHMAPAIENALAPQESNADDEDSQRGDPPAAGGQSSSGDPR